MDKAFTGLDDRCAECYEFHGEWRGIVTIDCVISQCPKLKENEITTDPQVPKA